MAEPRSLWLFGWSLGDVRSLKVVCGSTAARVVAREAHRDGWRVAVGPVVEGCREVTIEATEAEP